MNTTKITHFTPGPWHVAYYASQDGHGGGSHYAAKVGNKTIARTINQVATPTDEANINLIAAAPAMYADLCAVRDYLFELYDEGNAKAGEYAASLDITIEQAEGRHHE